jgi:hypothetical protein
MNPYILIVLSWIGGSYTSGAASSMQEFRTATACEEARAELMKQATDWRAQDKYRAFCVPK